MRLELAARYAARMRMRAALAMIVAVAAIVAGCDVPPGGPPPPAASSFDARCSALPPSRFDVVALPLRVTVDRTRSQRDLTGMYELAAARHQTMGLTQAHLGHRATVAVNGLQESGTGRACMRADVRVELAAEPVTLFLARELDADPCRQAAVREHEMQHVAVYDTVLAASGPELERALAATFGGRTFTGPSPAAVEAEVGAAIGRHLDAFLEATGRTLRTRQAAVDTPAEYARVSAACSGRPSP